MDYKNLIDRLKKYKRSNESYNNHGLSCTLKDSIEAIEALLAGRESNIVKCKNCEHFRLCGGNTIDSSYNWCAKFRMYINSDYFCGKEWKKRIFD